VASPHRLRLDRTQRVVSASAPIAQGAKVEKVAPQIIVMEQPDFLVAVVPDAPGGRLSLHDRQLFGAARTLAGKSGGVLALVPEGCDDPGAAGADRVGLLSNGDDTSYDPDGFAAAIASVIAALAPRHVLFPETSSGGDIARRVALLADEALFCDIEVLAATSVARAAKGRRIEQRGAPTRFITLAVDATAPYAGAPREARPEPFVGQGSRMSASAILRSEDIPADPSSVPLALADFVTSAGNGVTDFETFRQLVVALGATPGASRVLCDAGLMPRGAQVGASGTVLAATCYLAFGIAGAPQHLQGVAGCEHVVAVNTDLHAAMIERAGLAIVQDAQVVMPALLAALQREGG
jgi:electron transfer flavoprotein alpha subunit